jgi:type I restriction enzyme M protein
MDYRAFLAALDPLAEETEVKLTAKRLKLLRDALAQRDETAQPVVKKVHKPGKAEADPLHGRYEVKLDGKCCIVEYEPDSELRDTEQIPLLEEGGIDAFIQREVLPHAPDAWVDDDATRIGYEISFNRYFYKPQPLRSLEEIRADILAVNKETEGLLAEIVGDMAEKVKSRGRRQ